MLRRALLCTATLLLAACSQTPVTPGQDAAPTLTELRRPAVATGPSGTLDPSYGAQGSVSISGLGQPVDVDAAGGVILLQASATQSVLRRLDPRGRVDRRFGRRGVLTLPAADAVGVAPDGDVLLVQRPKSTPGLTLRRYRDNGQPERRFGARGVATFTDPRLAPLATPAQFAPDGAVYVGVTGGVARVTAAGVLDTAFADHGVYRLPESPELLAGLQSFRATAASGLAVSYSVSGGDSYSTSAALDVVDVRGQGVGGLSFSSARFTSAGDVATWASGAYAFLGMGDGGASPHLLTSAGVDVSLGGEYGLGASTRLVAQSGDRSLVYEGSTVRRLLPDGALDRSFAASGSDPFGHGLAWVRVAPDDAILASDGVRVWRLFR
ncbi:hypothetical protein [Deinococcus yunweiensis]|uniref:hypothetical protein n=1 Tax=Deinococcus yunweiensis TaxID=367282 RepID=UPI00398F4357